MYQVTCMHDYDVQCFGDCPGCIRAEINRLKELKGGNTNIRAK